MSEKPAVDGDWTHKDSELWELDGCLAVIAQWWSQGSWVRFQWWPVFTLLWFASCSNPLFDLSSHLLPHCMLEIPQCCMVTPVHLLGYFDHIWAWPQLLECSQTIIEEHCCHGNSDSIGQFNKCSVTRYFEDCAVSHKLHTLATVCSVVRQAVA